MPKLVLKFDDRVLKEWSLAADVSIGRLPDNTIAIDNQGVSSRHARIVRHGDAFVIEDLGSRNGTFVNGRGVVRHTLSHGDEVLVGKHKLLFDQTANGAPVAAPVAPTMPDLGGTVMLDTEQQRRLMAAVAAQLKARAQEQPAAAPTPAPAVVVGTLRAVGGGTDTVEYDLSAERAFIGKARGALVRLEGWFKPRTAVVITRMGEGYIASLVAGRTFINGERLQGRRGLDHGDLLQVSGLTLEFRLKQASM